MGLLGTAIKIALAYELVVFASETVEKHKYWRASTEYCNAQNKALLRIGMQRSFLEPPNGDITVDIDPAVLNIEGGVWADERNMPFANKQFGVCFNEHTLEHLHSPEDVQDAVNECVRVADTAVFLAPSPYSLYANLFAPTHNLRLWFNPVNNKIAVMDNRWKTGLGARTADECHPPHNIGQALVASEFAPQVITIGKGFMVATSESNTSILSAR